MLSVVGLDGSPLGEAARVALESAELVVGESGLLDGLPVAPERARSPQRTSPALCGMSTSRTRTLSLSWTATPVTYGDPPRIVRTRPRARDASCSFPGGACLRPRGTSLGGRADRLGPGRTPAAGRQRVPSPSQGGGAHRARAGPAELARALFPVTPRSFVVCEDLGGPTERVVYVRPGRGDHSSMERPASGAGPGQPARLGGPGWCSGPPDVPRVGSARRVLRGRAGSAPGVRAFVLAGWARGSATWCGTWSPETAPSPSSAPASAPRRRRRTRPRDVGERIKEGIRLHGVKAALATGDVRPAAATCPSPTPCSSAPASPAAGLPEAVRACAGAGPRPPRGRRVREPTRGRSRRCWRDQGFTTGAVRRSRRHRSISRARSLRRPARPAGAGGRPGDRGVGRPGRAGPRPAARRGRPAGRDHSRASRRARRVRYRGIAPGRP